jgi:murein DD-endopeptidase MepM/ murein hydrolase activator NlpD
MNEYTTSYPVKIVSRSASLARLRKVRLSWLAASIAFGLGCTSALTPMFDNIDAVVVAKNEIAPAVASIKDAGLKGIASLEDIVGAAPVEIPTSTPDELATNATTITNKNTEPMAKKPIEIAQRYPLSLDLKVQKGDNLVSLLTDAGVSSDEAQSAFNTVRTVFNPRKLVVGNTIAIRLDKNSDGNVIVRNLKLPISTLSTVELSRSQDDEFAVKKIDVPLTKKLAHAGGTINSSIYQTGAESGIPSSMLGEIINAYSYDVDFQRDVKKGNSIDVLFERMETKDGVVAGNGNLVFAELNLGNRDLKLYRYVDKNGNSDFYNEKGESIRKAMLRTPINGAKITSAFGMRVHPLFGYSKMHKGVDFGAPTGTPIYAAGDGTVAVVKRENGYGNYLRINHNNKYASAYAHLSRYASGIAVGKHVKQGQIIAYVGMTGDATGPHLHYEILANNEQVNPANVKFKTGNVLAGKELLAFRGNIGKIEARLASLNRGKTVAMVSEPTKAITN